MGRMTSLLWKTKIHVPNHQPDNKHRNTLAENDFYTILDKRVALRGLRNMLAEYMALKMEKKKFFSPKIVISTSGFGGSPQLGRQFSRPESPGSDSQPVVFFGKSHGFGIMLTGCCFSHRSAKIFHMAPGMLVLDPRTNFGRKSQFSVDSA